MLGRKLLDCALNQPLNVDAELVLIQFLWNKDASPRDLGKYQSYISFYNDEMRRLQFSVLKESQLLPRTAVNTHTDVIKVIEILSKHRHLKLLDVHAQVRAVFSTSGPEAIQTSIDLALRVWLTLNVQQQRSTVYTGVPSIQWIDNNASLTTFIAQQFHSHNLHQVDPVDSRLDQRFTATYLNRACSVRIEWTTCIADHLRYDEGEKCLRIYGFKQCLSDHLHGLGTSLSGTEPGTPILPHQLLREVLWSLNQLFPLEDKQTRNFLSACGRTFNKDGPLDNHRPTHLSEYHHLRARLSELQHIYDAEPENFAQLIRKRQSYENKVQLILTILLGFVLAMVFGVIGSATAIISTRATLQGLELSQKALVLAQQAFALQQQAPICPCA